MGEYYPSNGRATRGVTEDLWPVIHPCDKCGKWTEHDILCPQCQKQLKRFPPRKVGEDFPGEYRISATTGDKPNYKRGYKRVSRWLWMLNADEDSPGFDDIMRAHDGN